MSRRKQRAREPGEAGREPPSIQDAPDRRASAARWGLAVQILFVVAVFALAVLIAELAGAANLGVSFGVGQIAFAIAVAYLLIRR
jgi:hypothetical protein